MQYIKVSFQFNTIEEYQKDLLIDELGNIGYTTFEDVTGGFAAFIDLDSFNEEQLNAITAELDPDLGCRTTVAEIAAENWNEEWEKNFEPLVIDDQCYVRATFHQPKPEFPYEIVIDPKMAFGTGHHQTTTMMMQYLLSADIEGQTILDMGCGTGILAILAAKRGAGRLVAIDNDDVCYLSTLENAGLNNISNIEAICGGKEVIPQRIFDTILANINRNILLDQIPVYANVLRNGGDIYFSGFYESPDLDMIKEACATFSINYIDHKKIGDWVAAHFTKN